MSKILKFKKSKLLNKLPRDIKYEFLSTPFEVINYFASIPKVPIVIKKAPKDTIEYQKMNEIPKIPPEKYVFSILNTNKHLSIYIIQSEKFKKHQILNFLKVWIYERYLTTIKILKGCFTFKIPDNDAIIKIKIPLEDAKTIYRALPERAKIIIVF